MRSRCCAASGVVALLIASGAGAGAHAQGMNIEKYCKDLYGDQSRASLLEEHNANSWRCAKGRDMVGLDLNDLCLRQYGPDRGAVLGNPTDPKSWTCVPRYRELSGVVPPERVAEDLERDAKKMLDEGKTTSFCRKFYFFFARNTAEFAALAKNTVFLLSVWMKKPEELPIKRFYVRAGGQDTTAAKIVGTRSEMDSKSVAAQMCGSHREDGIYLVPTGAMLRDGVIKIDFAANRTGYNLLELPSRVALDRAEKNSMFKSPNPAPNARPDLKGLQAFIGLKLPGYPLPTAVP